MKGANDKLTRHVPVITFKPSDVRLLNSTAHLRTWGLVMGIIAIALSLLAAGYLALVIAKPECFS